MVKRPDFIGRTGNRYIVYVRRMTMNVFEKGF